MKKHEKSRRSQKKTMFETNVVETHVRCDDRPLPLEKHRWSRIWMFASSVKHCQVVHSFEKDELLMHPIFQICTVRTFVLLRSSIPSRVSISVIPIICYFNSNGMFDPMIDQLLPMIDHSSNARSNLCRR